MSPVHRARPHELLDPNLIDLGQPYAREFEGMTRTPVPSRYASGDAPEADRRCAIAARRQSEAVPADTSKTGSLTLRPSTDRRQLTLPAVQWKLLNLNKLKRDKPCKARCAARRLGEASGLNRAPHRREAGEDWPLGSTVLNLRPASEWAPGKALRCTDASAMDHLSDQSCQPSWELRRGGHQFGLCRLRELGSQDLQGLGSLIWPKPCQSADNLAGCLAPKGQPANAAHDAVRLPAGQGSARGFDRKS